MDFLQIFMWPFSFLMKTLYHFIPNYGLSLIIFAFLIKVVLFPFSLKGKRGMIQMNMLQGKMKQIQAQYKDKARQNEEIQKLYAKENVNPMGGCLWTMIPMFILIPLYAVVRRPLRYLMGLNDTLIASVTTVATGAGVAMTQNYPEIGIVSAFHTMPDLLSKAQAAVGDAATLFGMNFNFLGVDLSAVPTYRFWEMDLNWNNIGLFLIPLLAAAASFISSKIMMKTNAINNQSAQQNSTSKSMMLMGPVMALWIGYVMPAGMGLYWIANSVFMVVQELIAGRMLKKDYEAAALARAEQDRLDKEEEKTKRREAAERKANAIAEGKNKKGANKPQQEKKPSDTAAIAVSGVGTRAYARGRAYDPNRYSENGPTTYTEVPAPEVKKGKGEK